MDRRDQRIEETEQDERLIIMTWNTDIKRVAASSTDLLSRSADIATLACNPCPVAKGRRGTPPYQMMSYGGMDADDAAEPEVVTEKEDNAFEDSMHVLSTIDSALTHHSQGTPLLRGFCTVTTTGCSAVLEPGSLCACVRFKQERQ